MIQEYRNAQFLGDGDHTAYHGMIDQMAVTESFNLCDSSGIVKSSALNPDSQDFQMADKLAGLFLSGRAEDLLRGPLFIA